MPEDDLAAEIADIANQVFERQEFKHYAGHQADILTRLLNDHAGTVVAATASARASHQDALDSATKASSVRMRRSAIRLSVVGFVLVVVLGISLFVTVGSTAAVAGMLSVDVERSWLARNLSTVVFLSWIATALCLVVLVGQWLRRRAAIHRIMLPAVAAAGVLARSMTAAVQEAVSTAINTELGPKGIVAFPTHAPRLVELDVTQVRQSTTTAYIKEFILEHESSAIGLAGTRGSGKSTVMRSLKTDSDMNGPVVIVPSPVRYDAGEFIRLLLTEIARAVSGGHGRTSRGRLWERIERLTLSKLIWIMLLGLGVAVLPELILPSGASATPTSSWLTARLLGGFTLPQWIAILMVAFVGEILVLKIMMRLRVDALPQHVRRARELLRDLRWEAEQGTTSKSTMKFQSLFELGGEKSLKLKSRAMGRSELVGALRDLLKAFASHTSDQRMVVCVDELDKISEPKHLVEIINELKDLFHIEAVHFLVTVSTDALDSFERRGLAGRDAFDSSFDTVVHTRWLTLNESLDIVRARATGFPPIVAMLCHAWSGGLARDLLRAARTAVELQRRDPQQPLKIGDIIGTLVFDDLEGAVLASMRGLEPNDRQLDDLWALQQKLVSARHQNLPVTQALHDVAMTIEFETPALKALQAKALLGLSLLRIAQAATSLPHYWLEQGPAIANLRAAAIRHASAIRSLGEPAPIRQSNVQAALREFDSNALGIPMGNGQPAVQQLTD